MYYSGNKTITGNNIITGNKIILGTDTGIGLYPRGHGNLISKNTIELSSVGIGLYADIGSGDIVSDNVVKANEYGIFVSVNSTVTGNKAVENTDFGIWLSGKTGIKVRDNHFRGNGIGIDITWASGNSIYRNNFIANGDQVHATSPNIWHGRWNVTGNYWSDCTDTDTNGDGTGDTPYIIDSNNKDNFPFMNPYLPGDINHDGQVNMIDLNIISKAYGSSHGHPSWDRRADLNEDAVIGMNDMNIASANFGKTWQTYWGE